MNLPIEAIKAVLGIEGPLYLSPKEMAKQLTVTFMPPSPQASPAVLAFSQKLKTALPRLGVKIIPFDQTLIDVPEVGRKVRKGIVVIASGDYQTGNLAINRTYSFTENPIVTILDKPDELQRDLSYASIMDSALKLFTWHMCNIIIACDASDWMLFSFNGHSPLHSTKKNFLKNILLDFIPKISTRVSAPRMEQFTITKSTQNFTDTPVLKPFLNDFIESGPRFAETGLFPPMKKIEGFSFRNDFYRWAASLHLDERSGMSYGFIARQLPQELNPVIPLAQAKKDFKKIDLKLGFFRRENDLFVVLPFLNKRFVIQVPDVWVLMSRSGSEKTKLDPVRDILKIGLINGRMFMEVPHAANITEDYKPSFDTRVILAHAVANALFASVLQGVDANAPFSRHLQQQGMALVHWHRDIPKDSVPRGWFIHGEKNPPVLCSSSQAAVFAFLGKARCVEESIRKHIPFRGDIHIEPQHGINISWDTLEDLSHWLLSDSKVSCAG